MRYEYATVFVNEYDPGDPLSEAQDTMLVEELDKVGLEGWEAFATLGDTVLLRRPLPEAGGPYRAPALPPGTWITPVAPAFVPTSAESARAIAAALERWVEARAHLDNRQAAHDELVKALTKALGGAP